MVETKTGFTHKTIYLWRLDTQEMASFSCDLSGSWHPLHVVHSLLTNYLFIRRGHRVEIWDVSATGSKMIWKPASTSHVTSICPSSNGHRVLVGYKDGIVRMWNLDLENLAITQADTADTRDDSDERQVIKISPSGKMVITRSWQSPIVEFLDTTTREVVARTDIEWEGSDIEIAFSPNEDQVAILHKSLTICDIMHPEKRVSFVPWPGKRFWKRKVAFQTCNDLVICADSGLLQVWHRQDHASFKCMYFLDSEHGLSIDLAPNGLAIIVIRPLLGSTTCYSWNHETAQFDPVHFDDQVHILWDGEYSSDGKLFACWSRKDSHIRVWDTQTGHLVSKFPISSVTNIALSPALINHSLGKRLIALSSKNDWITRLFDAYTGHLHAQILRQPYATTAFIRDGTALADYYYYSGVRIWEIADFTAEHRHSSNGHELMLQCIRDGWMMGQDDEPLFWVPVENRGGLYVLPSRVLIEGSYISTGLDFSNSRFGKKWMECIDKGWLKVLEQKEKEIGNVLE